MKFGIATFSFADWIIVRWCPDRESPAATDPAVSESHTAVRGLVWLRYAAAAAVPLLIGVAVWCVLHFPLRDWQAARGSAERVELLRGFFLEAGPAAPAAYLLFVTVEVVVAPIPGLMLYAPGGLIFGAIPGGLLALAGNVLGAGISCVLARRFGEGFVARLDRDGRLAGLRSRLARHGFLLIFLLRLNPLTSSDLISWAAGLSRIRISTVMFATALGMAPLCLLQSWLSDGLFRVWPGLIGPLMWLTAVLFAGVLWVLLRLSRRR